MSLVGIYRSYRTVVAKHAVTVSGFIQQQQQQQRKVIQYVPNTTPTHHLNNRHFHTSTISQSWELDKPPRWRPKSSKGGKSSETPMVKDDDDDDELLHAVDIPSGKTARRKTEYNKIYNDEFHEFKEKRRVNEWEQKRQHIDALESRLHSYCMESERRKKFDKWMEVVDLFEEIISHGVVPKNRIATEVIDYAVKCDDNNNNNNNTLDELKQLIERLPWEDCDRLLTYMEKAPVLNHIRCGEFEKAHMMMEQSTDGTYLYRGVLQWSRKKMKDKKNIDTKSANNFLNFVVFMTSKGYKSTTDLYDILRFAAAAGHCKCARTCFDEITEKNKAHYGLLLTAYFNDAKSRKKYQHWKEVKQCLSEMVDSGFKPNENDIKDFVEYSKRCKGTEESRDVLQKLLEVV